MSKIVLENDMPLVIGRVMKRIAGFLFGIAIAWLFVFDATALFLAVTHHQSACLHIPAADFCIAERRP
jgi:hypothetical protein